MASSATRDASRLSGGRELDRHLDDQRPVLAEQLPGVGHQPFHQLLDVDVGRRLVHRVRHVHRVVGLELGVEPVPADVVDRHLRRSLAVGAAADRGVGRSEHELLGQATGEQHPHLVEHRRLGLVQAMGEGEATDVRTGHLGPQLERGEVEQREVGDGMAGLVDGDVGNGVGERVLTDLVDAAVEGGALDPIADGGDQRTSRCVVAHVDGVAHR